MKIILFFLKYTLCFWVQFCTPLAAQQFSTEDQKQLDSLNAIVNNPASHDTSLANAYLGLSEILYVSNPDTMIPLCEKAKKFALKNLTNSSLSKEEKKAFRTALAGAFNNIGYIYNNQGDIAKALEYYHRSLKIQEEIGDKSGLGKCLIIIGFIYQTKGNILMALDYYNKGLAIMEEIGDKKGISETCWNIGNNFNNQGDIVHSLDFLYKSLKTQEKIGDKQGMAYSLISIANIYQVQKDFIQSLNYYHKSLKICEEIGDKQGIALISNNIGLIYSNQRELADALKFFHKSLKIQEEIGDKPGIGVSLINIGSIYEKQVETQNTDLQNKTNISLATEFFRKSMIMSNESNDRLWQSEALRWMSKIKLKADQLDSAELYAKQSMNIVKEFGYPEFTRNAAELISTISRKQALVSGIPLQKQVSLWQEALKMYELYIVNRDSVLNKETQKAAIRQQTKYEFEKEMLVKEQKEKEKKRQEQSAVSRRDKLQNSVIMLGLFVVFGIVFMMGRIRLSHRVVELLIFIPFLLLFEFILTLLDNTINMWTGGAPFYKLFINALLAMMIFPLHRFLESVFKKRLFKGERDIVCEDTNEGGNKTGMSLLMVICFWILVTGFRQPATSYQQSVTDSLLNELKIAQHDTAKLNVLIELVETIEDDKIWHQYNKQAMKLAQHISKNRNEKIRLKGKKGLAETLNNTGIIYHDQGNIAMALEYHLKSLKIQEEIGDKKAIAVGYNNLGFIYNELGDIVNALKYHHNSLKIREAIGDVYGIAQSLNNIGIIYKNQNDTAHAIEYYQRSLMAYEKINDKKGIAACLNNMGIIYDNKNDFISAMKYYHESLKIQEATGNKQGIAVCYHNLGEMYSNQSEISTIDSVRQRNILLSNEYFHKSLILSKEIDDRYWQCFALLGLTNLKLLVMQLDSAKLFGEMGLKIANELEIPAKIRDASYRLSNVYRMEAKTNSIPLQKQVSLWKAALKMYEVFIVNRDSVLNKETQKATIRQQTKYEFEKAMIVKEQEEREKKRQEAVVVDRRDKLQNSVIMIGLFVVFGIVFLLGRFQLPPNLVGLLVFIPFLLFFEFILTLFDSKIDVWTGGAPFYKLLINAGLAMVIFPMHRYLEGVFKRRLFKRT